MPFAEWVNLPTKEELAGLSPNERRKVQQRIYQKRCKFRHPEYEDTNKINRKKKYAADPVFRQKIIAATLACRKKNWHKRIEAYRKKYAANPLLFREYRLKRAHGLTQEQWLAMFKAQGEVCALCGSDKPAGRRGWSTDHDHKTKKIRGILCNKCNTGLGLLGDSVDGITRALEYLKRSEDIGQPRAATEGRPSGPDRGVG